MLTAAKEGTFPASSDPCVFFPLAAAGVYPKTRVWGSKPENLDCFSATAPLKIELRWGYEESSEKTPVGSGVSFKYDPFGRRVYKSSSSGTSVFAYDGDNLVEETNSSGTVVARYSQGLNIDEPLAMLRSGATSFYHTDGLGSISSLSNAAGALAQTYTFDSFGKQTGSSGSLTNPFQYTAREFDAETGLYYYRARYYDSSSGRFWSEDPLRFFSGQTSFYPYVEGNPVSLADPQGLTCYCTYSQSTGHLKCVDAETGNVVADTTGYAGNGPGKNNPDMNGANNVGPLPRGSYMMGRAATSASSD
jgi:RHS repeat-associated protein